MLAGVISDSHGRYDLMLRAVAAMGPIDLLLHAGDGAREVERWSKEHPDLRLVQVRGNCDPFGAPPEETVFDLAGRKILLTHGHLYGVKHGLSRLMQQAQLLKVSLAVYGHTHQPRQDTLYGITFFNPGSLSAYRSYARPSYGLIEIGDQGITAKVGYI